MNEPPSPETLFSSCALFDLTGRGTLRVRGKERKEFLHGLVTNDVNKLAPGQGCYAAVLTPKGKMRADLTILCMDEELLIDTEPELAGPLTTLLSGYLFYQEAAIENVSDQFSVFHIEGPGTAEALLALGCTDLSLQPLRHLGVMLDGIEARVVFVSRGGSLGADIRVPRDAAPQIDSRIQAAGARPAPLALLETGRIESGIPRWGMELDESVLPNEARLERNAISYTKGCYMGQETVARIKTYGHVNRLLVSLLVELPSAPLTRGNELRTDGAKVGSLTSVAPFREGRGTAALGFVKREFAEPGTLFELVAGDGTIHAARVVDFPLER